LSKIQFKPSDAPDGQLTAWTSVGVAAAPDQAAVIGQVGAPHCLWSSTHAADEAI